MPFIKANDAEFYYELHGTGHPLVLIAGYTCDHTFWLPILDQLAKQYQVLIFDNRSAGQTKDAGVPLSAELMAKDTLALCEALHLKKPHILGQSMGGTIAQTFAALYPDKISKLSIVTSASKWRETLLFSGKTLIDMRKDNVDLGLIVDLMMPWIYGDEFLLNPENVLLIKKLILENPFMQLLEDQIRQYNFLRDFDGREQLKHIAAPTLIVYGVADIASLPADSKLMADNIRDAELVELDCAHGIVVEAPVQLVRVLCEFF